MKKQIMTILGLAAVIAGCNKTALEEKTDVRGEGVWATIEQPFSPTETKALSWGDNKLSFTWATDESVVAFGGEDAALLRTLSPGTSSSKIESNGFQLVDDVTYYAFIPADNFNIVSKSTAVPLNFLDQRQTKNDNSDHLRYYDYAYAKATKAADANSLEFNLLNQVSWIVVEHTFTEVLNNVTSLSLSTTTGSFISSAKLNLSTGALSGKKTSKELTLGLGTATSTNGLSFAEGEFLRAFFTILPTNFSNKEITLTAYLKDGSSKVLGTFKSASLNIPRNTPAILRTSGSATPVASYNGKNYSSLNAAIKAAESATKPTITLSGDVKENVVVNQTKSALTIDLAGHSITAAEGDAVIVNGGSVRLTNGNIVSEKGSGVKLGSEATSATVTLEDCNVSSVEGAVCTSTATGCKINIYGGVLSASDNAVIAGNGSKNYKVSQEARTSGNTIVIGNASKQTIINGKTTTDGYKACGVYAPWKDNITITNTSFNIENGVGVLSRGGAVTINSGKFVTSGEGLGKVGDSRAVVPCKTVFIDSECGYPELSNAQIAIKAGSFSDDAGSLYVADGSKLAETGDADAPFVVTNNADAFIAAIGNAAEGTTVNVEDNVVLSGNYTIDKNVDLHIKENVTLSSSSSTTPNGVLLYKSSGKLSGAGAIKASSSTSSNSTGIAVQADGGTVTIDGDLTITCEQGQPQATPIKLWFGKVVINGGHFISGADKDGNESPAVHLYPTSGSAELEINGGIFESSVTDAPNYLINCEDSYRSRCTIVIKGGTFVGFNPADNISEGKGTNYVPDGYVSTKTTLTDGRTAWVVSKAE